MNKEQAAREMRSWARALVRRVDELLNEEPDPTSKDWLDGYKTASVELYAELRDRIAAFDQLTKQLHEDIYSLLDRHYDEVQKIVDPPEDHA